MPGVNTGIVALKNCSGDEIISFGLPLHFFPAPLRLRPNIV